MKYQIFFVKLESAQNANWLMNAVNKFIEDKPNAAVEWHQTGAGAGSEYSCYDYTTLTAIVKY